MQKPILPKNWHLPGGILSLGLVFLFVFAIPRTSVAIYATIIAKQNIAISANGSFVDSFDSADPLESTNGQYDPNNPGDNGMVVSATGSVFIGNAEVYGSVWALSPALVFFEADGGIGTHAWLSTNSGVEPGHIENGPVFGFPTVTLPYTNGAAPPPGTFTTASTNLVSVTNSSTPPPPPAPSQTINCSTNLYITGTNTIIQVTGSNQVITLVSSNLVCGTVTNKGSTLPPNCCSFVAEGSGGGPKFYLYTLIVGTNVVYQTNNTYTYSTNYVYRFGTNYNYTVYTTILQTNYYDHILCGNYCAGNLSGVTLVTCPSTLVLTNGLMQMGIDTIIIMPGASLSLYVDGGDVILGGGGISNLSGFDTNLQIYCTPGVSHLVLEGTAFLPAPLSAEIVAPDTDISIGGGPAPVEFSGNIMARSLAANGVLHMHGDEAVSLLTAPVVVATMSPPALMPAQSNPVVAVGWQVTFHASYMGSGMSLQWFFNGTNLIANATNSSLSLSNVTTDMAGEYSLQVSGPGIFFVSEPAWLTVVPTPAATLDSSSLSAANQFQFNVNGLPGYNYRVDGSSNLIDWTPLGGGLSPFSFTDTNQPGLQYFYRAVYVPTP